MHALVALEWSLPVRYDAAVPRPDAQTIARAQSGDARALREALDFLYPLVRKHLSFMFGFRRSVDDAVQESMLAIVHALPSFAARASLKTWALKIAFRTTRRHLAALEAEPQPAATEIPESIYEVDFEARSEMELLARCLSEIAPKKREAFVLMEILGMTAEEAGAVLGTFANTAASRARHARAELEPKFSRRAER